MQDLLCTAMILFLISVLIFVIGILWGWWFTRMNARRARIEWCWTCGQCMMRFEIKTNDHKSLIKFRDLHLESHEEAS